MLIATIDDHGVGHLILNRPDVHNALSSDLIKALTIKAKELDADPTVRLLTLQGTGSSFCAGADMNEMRALGTKVYEDNLADAMALGTLFHTLNACQKPLIIKAHGAIMGGGVGLLACGDIVLIQNEAKLSLSEVKLGIIPAVISPFVIAKIGISQARALFISACRFDGKRATEMGLAHICVSDIDTAFETLIKDILLCAPKAQIAAKDLIKEVAFKSIDLDLLSLTAQRIATLRASAEAQEGLNAALEKRPPQWALTPSSKAST